MTKPNIDSITNEEIRSSVNPDRFPPILTPDQVAELLQVSRHTVYRWSSEGRFKHAIRRGRPLRFFRDRLVQAFFEEG
ncbi:MAG: helix-turn-helix domain-containing protein [Phycisphaeraceae bacterium]